MSNIAIKIENVSKTFVLPHEKQNSIKGALINLFKKGKRTSEQQQVLDEISLDIKKGEFFGIVGRNGSGKSTLLKLIAGIYQPSSGRISVDGKLTPFIELGVGFSPELTGRENVFLNGSLLGFNRKEMLSMYEDIVQFAELERFMDQKLKNYSSGMQVRLAFSIAIRARTDILILDEVLAVGDESFQRKCADFFFNIKKDKTKTVVLVTHSMESVKKYCTTAALIKDGKVIKKGNPDDVANLYSKENNESYSEAPYTSIIRTIITGESVLKSKDSFKFKIDFQPPNTEKKIYLAYALLDIRRGGIVYDSGIFRYNKMDDTNFSLPLRLFNDGEFRVVASIRVGKKDAVQGFTDELTSCIFSIRNNDNSDSYALLKKL